MWGCRKTEEKEPIKDHNSPGGLGLSIPRAGDGEGHSMQPQPSTSSTTEWSDYIHEGIKEEGSTEEGSEVGGSMRF